MSAEILISSLSLSGYRSINDVQRLPQFSKINLFIGQNNSGKSNILRFIKNGYTELINRKPLKLDALDRHLPTNPPLTMGICIKKEDINAFVTTHYASMQPTFTDIAVLSIVLRNKIELEGVEDVWFYYDESGAFITEYWIDSFHSIQDFELQSTWNRLMGKSGGGRVEHWIPDLISTLKLPYNSFKCVMIPAIRQVGIAGSESDSFSGEGIINKLAKLQNPDVHNQKDRQKFQKINHFLQSVTDNATATIEIPHDRATILVHMNGRTLPLDSLGTGIHEVIILAAASTLLEQTVICMEEPELHLNPILQKKLIRYLGGQTNNQYFISTHSAALMDTPDAEIYHVQLLEHNSLITRVTSDKHRSAICEELGYHPSDLLQSNCIIWVEGPSDRIYLNKWIASSAPDFIEGIHYAIMFYGGRLLSHLTADEDNEEFIKDFISLRRLNRRIMILIDSDKSSPQSHINETKKRLKTEFDEGPGYAWITAGREIENYLEEDVLRRAIEETKPSATIASTFGQYDNCLKITLKNGTGSQASKVAVANFIVEHSPANFRILDLEKRITDLTKFISESQPRLEASIV